MAIDELQATSSRRRASYHTLKNQPEHPQPHEKLLRGSEPASMAELGDHRLGANLYMLAIGTKKTYQSGGDTIQESGRISP